jgi:hypothetical protein
MLWTRIYLLTGFTPVKYSNQRPLTGQAGSIGFFIYIFLFRQEKENDNPPDGGANYLAYD